jgi:hypothetical protein
MSNHERRNSLALDDSFAYCRRLEAGDEQPELYKLCNAIRTLDLALTGLEDSPVPMSLCNEAWSRIRGSLYTTLVSSCKGRFEIYDQWGNLVDAQADQDAEWPEGEKVMLRFYPDQISRRKDSYDAELATLCRTLVIKLRWLFAERRQNVEPADFAAPAESEEKASEASAEPPDAAELLEKLYQVCQEQAWEGKKKAHRRWWQLYWEADSCPNKRQKHQLQKQMAALEGIWGRPSESAV